MAVYRIDVIGDHGRSIYHRYIECENREQAEEAADDDCGWLDGNYWEVSEIPMAKKFEKKL